MSFTTNVLALLVSVYLFGALYLAPALLTMETPAPPWRRLLLLCWPLVLLVALGLVVAHLLAGMRRAK